MIQKEWDIDLVQMSICMVWADITQHITTIVMIITSALPCKQQFFFHQIPAIPVSGEKWAQAEVGTTAGSWTS